MKPAASLVCLAALLAALPAFSQKRSASFEDAYQESYKDILKTFPAAADHTAVPVRLPPPYKEKIVAPIEASAELPEALLAIYGSERERVHVIFRDAGAVNHEGYPDTKLMTYWTFQARSISEQLIASGVGKERIHIVPVQSLDDYRVALSGFPGPKTVYVFGHAAPLRMYFGYAPVDFGDKREVEFLAGNGVTLLGHYGCKFLGLDKAGLEKLRSHLDGRKLTLFGHRLASTTFDDSWRHPTNPLFELSIAPASCPAARR